MQQLDQDLQEITTQFRQKLLSRFDEFDNGDRIVILTQAMRKLDELQDWVTDMRGEAVYYFDVDPERTESISSVARRAGLTPQALNRVAAIERAERGEI